MVWIELVSIGVGVAALLLGIWLLTNGIAKPGRWVLASLLLVLGAGRILAHLPPLLWGAQIPVFYSYAAFVVVCVSISLHLAFAVVFPEWSLSGVRKALLATSFLPAGLLLLVGFTSPGLLVDGVPSTGFGRLLALVAIASYFPALMVFAASWFSQRSGSWRRQFLYVLVAYLILNLDGGIRSLVSTFQDPGQFGALLLVLGMTLLFLQVLGVLLIATMILLRPAFIGSFTVDDSRFVLWFGGGALLVFLQFLSPLGPVLVEAVVVGLLAWGGALVQVVDAPLKLKFGVKSGVLGGIATAVVFLVQELIESMAAGPFGLAGGLAVAAGVVFVFTPVRRFAKRLSDQAMPGVESTSEWRRERALSLYQAALEGALRDGAMDVREAASLSALRQELGLTITDQESLHAKHLEGDGKGRRGIGQSKNRPQP